MLDVVMGCNIKLKEREVKRKRMRGDVHLPQPRVSSMNGSLNTVIAFNNN